MRWSACGHDARLSCHPDETRSFLVLLHTAHDYPTPVSGHIYFFSSKMHAAIMPRGFAPPKEPQVGCIQLSAVRCFAKYADIFPLVSECPHMCFLLDLLRQLLLKLLLLSRSADSHAVRLKIPDPPRTARVPTIGLSSRGFSCCLTCQPPQGYHPPCVQLRLHHRNVPTMLVQQPSLQHLGWVAIVPRMTLFVPRARMLVLLEGKALLPCPRS